VSGGLKMPKRGAAATMLSDLNAEHAAPSPTTENQPTNEESNVVSNVTTLQRTTEATNGGTNASTFEETGEASNERRLEGRNDATLAETSERSNLIYSVPPDERVARLEKALRLANDDELAVVTIRVSGKLNEYIDRYVDRVNRIHPKRKYRKQDAIAEAFAAFFADHPMPPAPVEEEL
jgi:hypothetical protein